MENSDDQQVMEDEIESTVTVLARMVMQTCNVTTSIDDDGPKFDE